jgi:hypothetical protein
VTGRAYIPEFKGNKKVDKLSCYLFGLHNEMKSRTEIWKERARKVYQELAPREYDGVELSCDLKEVNVSICPPVPDKCRGLIYIQVSGRILIDFHGYDKYHRGRKTSKEHGKGDTPLEDVNI